MLPRWQLAQIGLRAPISVWVENVAELTETERRQHIAEWVRLTEEKQAAEKPVHGAQVSDKGGRGIEGGISAAARELGITRDTARRAVKAESLSDEAKALADEANLGTVARAKAASAPDPDSTGCGVGGFRLRPSSIEGKLASVPPSGTATPSVGAAPISSGGTTSPV